MNVLRTFRPNASRTSVVAGENLSRVDGWTTNGFWMIRTVYEPKWLKILKSREATTVKPLLLLEKFKADNEVKPINQLMVMGDTPYILMQCDKFESWVNVYFISLLQQMYKGYSLRYYQDAVRGMIYVTRGDDVFAVLMPINI